MLECWNFRAILSCFTSNACVRWTEWLENIPAKLPEGFGIMSTISPQPSYRRSKLVCRHTQTTALWDCG